MANVAGSARLRDGELTDWSRTRIIRHAAEAEGHDFLVRDDFLGPAECDTICSIFPKLADRMFNDANGDPFWNNRFLWAVDIARDYPWAGRIITDVHKRALAAISEFYKLTVPIYFDMQHVMSWPVGMSMPPHADNANPDGREHGMAYRDFNGIVYLNDDYQGGEFYLTAHDIAVKPRKGMFVASTAGFHHEHSVLKVSSGGTRYTIPMFFTFSKDHADKSVFP